MDKKLFRASSRLASKSCVPPTVYCRVIAKRSGVTKSVFCVSNLAFLSTSAENQRRSRELLKQQEQIKVGEFNKVLLFACTKKQQDPIQMIAIYKV